MKGDSEQSIDLLVEGNHRLTKIASFFNTRNYWHSSFEFEWALSSLL